VSIAEAFRPDVPGSLRVLNVNDDASGRYVVSKILRRAGFEVFEAATGHSAVRQAQVHRPHVVVLDVRLPDISGLEVCKMLKSDAQTSAALVVQTSASYVTSADKAEGLGSGADAYLTQPFESEELVATIHSLLRGRRLEAEARQMAHALSEKDQRKDEFLAMLAHELRNPLSAILTASRLLQTPAPAVQRLASTVERQALHLARMVDDLLDVSRITRGKIQLRHEPVEMNDVVQRAIDAMRPTFERRSHELRYERHGEAMVVSADPVRLEQILCNLLGNAAKYTRDRGQVRVQVSRVHLDGQQRARVVVRDDGIGLSPEDQARIFDLFYQVDTSIARSQSGLGIGLTMAKRLIELQGGSIAVHSEGRDRGATFAVELPELVDTEVPLSTRTPTDSLEGTRVLVVDDNVDACELTQMSLEQVGCLVRAVHDGGEAMREVREHTFDAAVLDIGLPVLDGYQLARAISERLGSQRPKLIALTGYGRAEDRGRALVAGFDAHLTKPTDPDTLIRTIGSILKGARVRVG
jgi:signal transduction histidine kinase